MRLAMDGCSALHEAAKEEVARQFVAHQTVLAQIEARLLYFVDKFELEAVKQGTPGYCRVPSAHTASPTVHRYGPRVRAVKQRRVLLDHCNGRVLQHGALLRHGALLQHGAVCATVA
jgi:hypothetical protein